MTPFTRRYGVQGDKFSGDTVGDCDTDGVEEPEIIRRLIDDVGADHVEILDARTVVVDTAAYPLASLSLAADIRASGWTWDRDESTTTRTYRHGGDR